MTVRFECWMFARRQNRVLQLIAVKCNFSKIRPFVMVKLLPQILSKQARSVGGFGGGVQTNHPKSPRVQHFQWHAHKCGWAKLVYTQPCSLAHGLDMRCHVFVILVGLFGASVCRVSKLTSYLKGPHFFLEKNHPFETPPHGPAKHFLGFISSTI